MTLTLESPTLKSFIEGVNNIRKEYYASMGYSMPRAIVQATMGKKYIKLIVEHSAFAFVDPVTGDIFKPASWAAPAKHARGNLFDESNGLSNMGPYGPAYLK